LKWDEPRSAASWPKRNPDSARLTQPCRKDTEHSGRITKRGTKLGRTTLIQCALIAQRYSPYLKTYFEKMKARRGTGKAIVALARKFLGIIYRTLKNKWVFEDFPNFVLAEEATA
jgi:transposase